MIAQDDFVASREQDWKELDALLPAEAPLHGAGGPAIARVAALYRALSADVVACRGARYTPDLALYLDGLAARAHDALYSASAFRSGGLWALVARDFPRAVRNNARFLALAAALLFLPWAIGQAGAMLTPTFATSVLPRGTLDAMAKSYGEGFSGGRAAGEATGMAGFYVYNNVGIAFRCFATGIFFGLGSIFFLVYNGLVMGTVTGYVLSAGHGSILTFMCGHAPFELTAILISGAAGIQMGYSLVATGGETRLGSLRAASPGVVRQVLGAALMLAIAAIIEGFWSPSSAPDVAKWAVAGAFTIAVTLYFCFAGRAARGA